MTLIEILGIIVLHYIADFIFQTDEMAVNKSKYNRHLFQHVFIYSIIWFIAGLIHLLFFPSLHSDFTILNFCIITFICHFITDYITSRISSYFYKKEQRHNFFLTIGFDQVLHYTQLFLTYQVLKYGTISI